MADTRKWLPGRRVLISPIALGKIDRQSKRVTVSLSKDQVRHSPEIDGGSFSREREIEYYDYYRWPYYSVGGDVWGAGVYPGSLAAAQKMTIDSEQQGDGASVLRSAKELRGSYLEAINGEIGHVGDFIIDDETWEIRYIVVDTQNWWPGRKVLVSPDWIDRISWSDSIVYVTCHGKRSKQDPGSMPKSSAGTTRKVFTSIMVGLDIGICDAR